MYEWMIAAKHLVKRRKTNFISINFVISIMGVALGVMALIVVLAVMSGFDRELKTKIVGAQPHIVIEKVNGIEDPNMVRKAVLDLNIANVVSVARYVQGQAIVRSQTNAVGIVVRGVDPLQEQLSFFRDQIVSGELNVGEKEVHDVDDSGKEKPQTMGRILLGAELSRLLDVKVGDYVSIISPALEESSFMGLIKRPKSVPFIVGGIFRLGMSDYDSTLGLVGIERAQMLYRMDDGRVTGLGIRLRDVSLADAIKDDIQIAAEAGAAVQSWTDMNRNFFSALKVEKAVMTILLTLIILVAAFNIVSSLTMMVMEKTKDIGILSALGSSRTSISSIFLLEGFIIGALGVALGAVMGLLFAGNINLIADVVEKITGFSVFPRDIYFFDKIPTEINLNDVAWIVSVALATSLIAGLYPAYQAAKLRPAEALRYE